MKLKPDLLSMTRRVALTVLIAFAAVFVVLFAWLWLQSMAKESGEIERSLLKNVTLMVTTLDELNSEAGAQALASLYGRVVNEPDQAGEPPLHWALSRLDGSSPRHSGPVTASDLVDVPSGISTRQVAGKEWRLYAATGQHWKAVLIDDSPARGQWLGWSLFGDLAIYLGLALPLVLLPVWLLARASLQPLRRLSSTVAARSPLDTAPLPDTGRWKELAPLESALNQLFARMAHSLAREKDFVHDAAHELRTPLAVIGAQAHLVATTEGAERDQARVRLEKAVQRASHLTQQLLELARADSSVRLQPQPVDLMNLVRDALSLRAEAASAQGTELVLNGPDQLPMLSDPRAWRSIVDNLLDNALRYGGPGGTVTVTVEQAQDQLRLTVADEGPGIDPQHRNDVFDRFWRGTDHAQPGTGLGLAIVQGAARALGGHAVVQASDLGASVQVSLPFNLK